MSVRRGVARKKGSPVGHVLLQLALQQLATKRASGLEAQLRCSCPRCLLFQKSARRLASDAAPCPRTSMLVSTRWAGVAARTFACQQ